MTLTQISTDGVKNDAISHNKIPANAVQASELADNAVDTAAIVDDAVTAAKLANTSVSAGSYGSATAIPAITVDAQGRITSASTNNVNIPAGTTINNNADNRVITGSGTANTLEGESNLTFDGTNLNVGNTFTAHAAADNLVIGTTSGSNGMTILTSSATANIFFNDGSGNAGAIQYIHTDSPEAMRFNTAGQFEFDVNGTEKVRIDDYGVIRVGNTHDQGTSGNTKRIALGAKASIWGWASGQINGALTLADNYYWTGTQNIAIESDYAAYLSLRSGSMRFGTTASSQTGGNSISGGIHEKVRFQQGGGISFNGDTAAANALDDYEDGTWTINPHDGSCTTFSGRYTKIGNTVTVWGRASAFSNTSENDLIRLKGLPYSATSSNFATCTGPAMVQNVSEDAAWVAFSEGDQIKFYASNSGSFRQLRHNELNSNHEIYFSVTYTTV